MKKPVKKEKPLRVMAWAIVSKNRPYHPGYDTYRVRKYARREIAGRPGEYRVIRVEIREVRK